MNKVNLKSAILLLSLITFLYVSPETANAKKKNQSGPIVTIGCLSDLHSEYELITCEDVNDVRVRQTVSTTLGKIKETEDIDILLLGGDYTSLVTTNYENWLRQRQILADATRDVFGKKSYKPVVYLSGNHEYEAANVKGVPKDWNSADYYTFPMKDDIGELAEDECFYEEADNGENGTMSLLAAYHYNIMGVDFVALNTGKYLFASSSNYGYSTESVEWCGKKIESLYEENPNRLIFFLVHIPFGDSNSISYPNKGIRSRQESTSKLKAILSKYPDIIVLYGHDHGGDRAYIREKTSQRVTRYDTDGNVISSFDSRHVDGTAMPSDNSADTLHVTPSFFSIFMGSMRYYNNSIDKSYDEKTQIHEPRIAQALMIYVYSDRIEFCMKNYGETGTLESDTPGKGPITIQSTLVPYTVFRNVTLFSPKSTRTKKTKTPRR